VNPGIPRRVLVTPNVTPKSSTPPAAAPRRVVVASSPQSADSKPPKEPARFVPTPEELASLPPPEQRPKNKSGKPMSDAQYLALRRGQAKPGESKNPSGRTNDPRKETVAVMLQTFREGVDPATGIPLPLLFWLGVIRSERLSEKLFDKMLATMTPEQITQNFNSLMGGAGNNFEMLLMQNRFSRSVAENALVSKTGIATAEHNLEAEPILEADSRRVG